MSVIGLVPSSPVWSLWIYVIIGAAAGAVVVGVVVIAARRVRRPVETSPQRPSTQSQLR
ncbi:MAG TPA: hypothetical protein VJ021_06215 [Thermoplasmata archaeon]|nr:hypothetical protein [Thermoplasmata archaeon]